VKEDEVILDLLRGDLIGAWGALDPRALR